MFESAGCKPRNVLVLGAAGLVGERISQALARSTVFRPIAAVCDIGWCPGSPNLETRRYAADDVESLRRALTGIDFVIDARLTGVPRRTEVLCKAARCVPLRRIVHVSSMAVYGDARDVQTEAAPLTGPVRRYGQAMRDCEQLVQEYARAGGDAVILRPGCAFGSGSAAWAKRLGRLLKAGRLGDLGSAGDGVCNTIFIDDLVAATVSALVVPGSGCEIFNVSDPSPGTWNEFLIQFARLIGATPVRRLRPRHILLETRIVAPLIEGVRRGSRRVGVMTERLPEVITPSLARLFRQEMWLSPVKADQTLNFPRTPRSTALRETARWFLAAVARQPKHCIESTSSQEVTHCACLSR
jgi:nucleoside-diphosphate-sugar epimerase